MYFLTSTVLAVGTYVVVYRGTWLREQGAGLTVLVGGGTFLAAQFARVLLMGLFGVQPAQTLGAASGAALDWVRAVAVALLSLVEAAALYLATTRVAGRRWLGSLPLRARATAVGFGYALAETVLLRVPYLWMHARSVDWDASSLCVALEAAAADIAAIPWDAVAAAVIPAVEQHASICVGRPVRFDEKHKIHLKQRFDRDVLAFWSAFDQVQERMAASDWSTVRDDGRFIQSFITKSEPHLPLTLSPFLAAVTDALIHHTDVATAVALHSRPNTSIISDVVVPPSS